MAADQSAAAIGTGTLTANTDFSFNLTGAFRRIELVHHGDATEAVYFATATAEADLPSLTGGGADEEAPLLAGERLTQSVQKGDTWVVVRSAGIPTVSVVGIRTQDG